MAVKECYRNELDIKYTERKREKESYFEWTQGPYFSFAEGHIFYDTSTGYGTWERALNAIKKCCQIDAATPTICDIKRVSPDFIADEFMRGYSVRNLCEVLQRDISVIAGKTVDDLNKLLRLENLFEQVRNSHRDKTPSPKIAALHKAYDKSRMNADLIKLNRAVLEKFYKENCPQSQDKCIVEGTVEFTIYKADEKHVKLKIVNNYKSTQTEFVDFLKYGSLKND